MPGILAFALWMTSTRHDPFDMYLAPVRPVWNDLDLLEDFYVVGELVK